MSVAHTLRLSVSAVLVAAATGMAVFSSSIKTSLDQAQHSQDITVTLRSLAPADPGTLSSLRKAYPTRFNVDKHLVRLTKLAAAADAPVIASKTTTTAVTLATQAGDLAAQQVVYALELDGEPAAVAHFVAAVTALPLTHHVTELSTGTEANQVSFATYTLQEAP